MHLRLCNQTIDLCFAGFLMQLPLNTLAAATSFADLLPDVVDNSGSCITLKYAKQQKYSTATMHGGVCMFLEAPGSCVAALKCICARPG